MSELTVYRGRDVRLYLNSDDLFGVTEFNAHEKRKLHDVYEYLSSSPYDRVPQSAGYEIRLSILSLFSNQIPDDVFTISVKSDYIEYLYEGCILKESRHEVHGVGSAREVFIIEAQKLTKREVEDD